VDHLPVYCSNTFEGSLVITRTIGIAIGIGIGIEMVLGHEKLDVYRIAAMLGRLGGRGYSVKEGFGEYGFTEFDPDPDPDSDFDKI
jgi:hypothetical protein